MSLLNLEQAIELCPDMEKELRSKRISRIHKDVLLKKYKTQWKPQNKKHCCNDCKKAKIHRCTSCSKNRKLQNGTEK